MRLRMNQTASPLLKWARSASLPVQLKGRFLYFTEQRARLSSVTRISSQDGHSAAEKSLREAAAAQQPLVMTGAYANVAVSRWFARAPEGSKDGAAAETTLSELMGEFALEEFPYELSVLPESIKNLQLFNAWLAESTDAFSPVLGGFLSYQLNLLPVEFEGVRLLRFQAPLALLMAALRYNTSHGEPITRLYIAQSSLADLPQKLKQSILPPDQIIWAGRGDVYGSSLWLGLEPTYTPFHRDPNPNVFAQVCSSKKIRLLPPSSGDELFHGVKRGLGQMGSSRIRGEEMMQGREYAALHEAIWEARPPGLLQETEVQEGDMIYIPKGWWHSVQSSFSNGRLNGSVNWWFR